MKLSDPGLLRSQAYIDGRWREADDGKQFAVTDPATGELIAEVADIGLSETREAIEAAHAAQPAWAAKTAKERSQVLHRWFCLIEQHREDLAILMTREQGKPLAESRGEVSYGASFVEWFAEEAKRLYGDVIPSQGRDKRLLTIKQPVGVVAAITPWNFPIAMITRKAAPALAAGCSIVIKPSEDTPLSALALAELAARAGVPAGIVNVLPSNKAAVIGQELCENPKIRKLSFTGSTRVGKLLMQQCSHTMKKLSLELGGNAPFIVFDDADIEQAVAGAMASKFRNAGQTCVCANRILVQDGIYDAFMQRFLAAVEQLELGNGLDPRVNQGPLINAAAKHKVMSLVDDALSQGARQLTPPQMQEGHFVAPVVLADVTPAMDIVNEEIFGPVAPVIRFETEAEAIAIANDTPYGLAAYFYSRDVGRIWQVSEALEYGMVGINEGIISTEVAPFGGIKESGIGREGSRHGMDEYTEYKYLCMGGLH